MSNSESGISISTDSPTQHSAFFGNLPYIRGYHFINTTSGLVHYENVEIISGYRIKDKSSVVAKVSSSSLRLEREFYIMKKLYQYNDGPLYLVRPIEYLNFPNGLTATIYSDDGQKYYCSRQNKIMASNMLGYDNIRMHKDLGTFLRFAIKCLSCLEYIHKHNAVHGEIRPSAFQWNGEDDGPVKLWNFDSGSKSLESFLTTENWRKTTNNRESIEFLQSWLMYMSPEQTGRTTYAPDHRSDIYSLGIMFFTLLTGRTPFDGGPLEIVHAILSRKLPLVHELQLEIPQVLSRIIEKMTNKAPDDRYTSAHGVRYDLNECLNLLISQKEELTTEIIPLFPLAQHDVSYVFTLPKIIYGRHDVLQEMSFFIKRCAGSYKSTRLRSHTTKLPTVTETNISATDETVSDIGSELSETDSYANGSNGTCKSTTAKSYCTGSVLIGSDTSISANNRVVFNNSKTSPTTIVGVYGPGGIGKSALFTEIQPIARQNGYMATSKFDSRNKVPYSALAKLLSYILQQILSESKDNIRLFFDHFKVSLGDQYSSTTLMTDFVPELKTLLQLEMSTETLIDTTKNSSINRTDASSTTTEKKMNDNEARTRFHNLYVEIFRAISHWRMTTLFLDDLHQADEPSLELLKSLISSRIQLLIFMSYRDQEVTEKFKKLVLGNQVADIHLIRVEALGMNPLIDFICDTLHRPRETITPLAEIIYNRTRGNIFYATQLLQTLERKKLIFYDWEKNEWSFDLQEVNDATILDDNDTYDVQQLEFMVGRLRELPRAGRTILKWASFVGDSFTWNTIKNLVLDDCDGEDLDDDESTTMIDDDDNSTTTSILTGDEDRYDRWSNNNGKNLLPSDHKPIHRQTSAKSTISSTSSNNDPISGLQAVLQEGYIMPIGVDEFKWSHDRISYAASELANPTMRAKMHLKIAQYMMEEEEVDIFLVSDHLLKCIDLLLVMDDKQHYRQTLIEAGNRGRTFGAHQMAFAYYMGALQLGNLETQWVNNDEYPTTITLYNNAATLSLTVGEYDKTEELVNVIFKHGRTPSDRVPAYRAQARYYYGVQNHKKAIEILHHCLDDISPQERSLIDTSREGLINLHDEIEELVETLGIDRILQLPVSDDPSFIGLLGIMEEILLMSYWGGYKLELHYWTCRILKLAFTCGMVGTASIASIGTGLGYVVFCKKHAFAEKIGSIGIALADKYGTPHEKGFAYCIYGSFLISWKYHFRGALHYYQEGLRYSLSAGDPVFSGFNASNESQHLFYTGTHIADTLRHAEQKYQEIHSWSPSIEANGLIMCVIRTCKALQGQTYIDTPNVFDADDGFRDAHYSTEISKQSSNPPIYLNWYESFKMLPLVLYGHVDAAVEVGYRCYSTIYGHPCHRHTRMMLFYFSLALIEKCRQDTTNNETYLKQVQENQKLLHEYVVNSPINYTMYWMLIEAELAGFNGSSPDILQASRLYEDALNQAREGGWYIELCVIHEYTGAFYYRNGYDNIAYCFIKKSIDLYMGHGSYGKARHVSTKYSELLEILNDVKAEPNNIGVQTDTLPYYGTQTPPNAWKNTNISSDTTTIKDSSNTSPVISTTVNNNEPYTAENIPPVTTEQTLQCLDIVDMASILKSSHVISSEVRFDKLLVSMLDIIFENSGADCGAIILKEDKYGVCAYGCQNEPVTTYDPPKPLDDAEKLVSSNIINHTIHTGESIFIYNVKKDTRFAVGPWFERTGEKSVICMPITHKFRTVGCLLIEGVVGVFTQRHVTVLGLLCQQMGISTTNASLFKSVQRATMANVRMIEMQKQALEDARRSREAAIRATRLREMFLANMSHEIRTPFAGFYGMISLLAGTDLDPEQHDLVKTAKESCEMLLRLIDDLLNFSKLQAGKVSLDLSEVVVEDIIADVIEMLIAMAIQKRLNVTYEIASDVPPVVMADANRLRQIIINLLGNAIKFTDKGEIKIRCSVEKELMNSNQNTNGNKAVSLLFEVIDSGIGISDEQRKSLFVPFSQVDGSTTRKYGGTGLGLSICLQLVELMEGKIDAKSTSSKGSTFLFNIKATIPTSIGQSKSSRDELLSSLSEQVNGVRILVADKYPSTIALVQHLLPSSIVDGACTIQKLFGCNATNYQIIVIGLYLSLDPEFTERIDQFKQWLECAQCVLVLHYPTGEMGEMLVANKHWNNNNPPSAMRVKTTTDQKSREQQVQDINKDPTDVLINNKNNSNKNGIIIKKENKNHFVVRIAVPLRRKTLLRTITDMLKQTTTSSLTIAQTISSPRITSPLQRPRIPSRKSSENRKTSDPNEVLITPEERERFSSMHILIAEDNPVAQKLLYKQLTTRFGFQVTCANNGLEAIEAWTCHPQNHFVMAFFDHHMPKCDGVEATKRIRKIEAREKRDKPLPISALTADIQDSARQLCMKAGMNGYLTKPTNHKLLAEVLRRYCCVENIIQEQ
ncbi:hypothetical protein BDA99DRAFT_576957 [Phascolomyces articulosus]|uniref:histidine kinase n=1 Tax=Phascolomyces articulosus TaxID=60185 RepID=A0AAD5JMH8_9FUNG|nr:hypothetical protein BDA99DRAFT_576957 [Phascolomyces articulosus]